MTTLKEHIAFLQTLKIPYKGTLIEYLKHVIYAHYSDLSGDMIDTDSKQHMPFEDFVRACLQSPEGQGVKPASEPTARVPTVPQANETG